MATPASSLPFRGRKNSICMAHIPDTAYHKKLRADFRTFLYLVHRHLNLPEPTPVQLDMADYLAKGPKRAILMAFRGVGKSHITAAFAVWCLLCDPELKILVVSASEDRAIQFSTFARRLIGELPGLEYLVPYDRKKHRDSVLAFDVAPATASQSPSIKSAGITGQITGTRADILIADDVEVPNNSATQKMRDKLSESVKEFDAILKPGEKPRIVYLGTPQLEDSLYTHLPERGYVTRIWPARMPDKDTLEKYGGALAPHVQGLGLTPGQVVDPKRFSDEDLISREASYGRAGFALQFQLNTRLSDEERFPLKVRDLVIMAQDAAEAPLRIAWGPSPDRVRGDLVNVAMRGDQYYDPMMVGDVFAEYQGCVMSIDPSGRGADETGYAVGKMLNGRIFVPDAGGLKGGYDTDTLMELAAIAKKHKVHKIVVESNFGDGMYVQLLKPVLKKVYPVSIEEVRSSVQKERRIIDTLEPVMSGHRLVIDPSVVENDWKTIQKYDQETRIRKSLFYQMTRITYEKGALAHDDRLDALAMMVAYWVEKMHMDEEAAEAAYKQARMDEELQRFRKNALDPTGRRPSVKRNRWHNRGLGR